MIFCVRCGDAVIVKKCGARFCSSSCYLADRYGHPPEFRWPGFYSTALVPVPPAPVAVVDVPRRDSVHVRSARRVFVSGPCGWCGENFTIADQRTARFCSTRCQRSAGKARRGRFVVPTSVRLAIYERDGWVCQLCEEPVDSDLDPSDVWAATLDHVVPRSWTLLPDDRPENLRLAHRWCNSVRGDERFYDELVLGVA